jgi:hypothetical protein
VTVFELADGPLYDIPLFVPLLVEARRPSTAFATLDAMLRLVRLLRNDVPDPATAQVTAGPAVAVRLIGTHAVGRGSGPADGESRHADRLHDGLELGAVSALARRQDQRQHATAAVRAQVNLGGEPSAGGTERLTSRTTSARQWTSSAQT